ncbi:MAG: hypothetical protein ABIR98_04560 [Usitatibacter sp.]
MSRFISFQRVLALCLAASPCAWAADDPGLAAIRNEIRELKEAYEARIRALERRLGEAEATASQAPAPAVAVTRAPAPSSASTVNAFNPALSVVLQGRYANLSRRPSEFAIAGFALGDEVGPGRRGFGLGESELTLSANVDDRFAGTLTVALTPENTLGVEEAYAIYTGGPLGLATKFGRFFSGIGYQNEQHQHVWDFIDAPLAYQAFLGGHYANDGLQVKWVAPMDHFLELGAEAGNGDGFPGTPRDRNGIGSSAIYAHTGGDVGASHSWRAGISYLRTRAEDEGSQRLGVADFVWKYAPNGNARQTNFKLQGEYFRSTSAQAARRSGWYLQGIYQFMPRWRLGARYDRLDAGAGAEFTPRKSSVMVDFSPSDFSRLRLQLAQSRTQPEVTDNQVFLQYILSLGAHGAHRY